MQASCVLEATGFGTNRASYRLSVHGRAGEPLPSYMIGREKVSRPGSQPAGGIPESASRCRRCRLEGQQLRVTVALSQQAAFDLRVRHQLEGPPRRPAKLRAPRASERLGQARLGPTVQEAVLARRREPRSRLRVAQLHRAGRHRGSVALPPRMWPDDTSAGHPQGSLLRVSGGEDHRHACRVLLSVPLRLSPVWYL